MSLLRATLAACLLLPGIAAGEDVKLEVPEGVINRLLVRIGALSDSGVSQARTAVEIPALFEYCEPAGFIECPFGSGPDTYRMNIARCRKVGGGIVMVPSGDPLSWQWWALNASVKINAGSMTFTATVRYRVGDYWNEVTRTVAAHVNYSAADNAVYLQPNAFDVPLNFADGSSSAAPNVDVDRLFKIKLPIQPQSISVDMPSGPNKSLHGRATSGSAQYTAGKLTMSFNVGF